MALSKAARGALGVVLLLFSNVFMNTAWYLHLKYENWNYAQAIFISWGIALPEYSLQVPANRLAHQKFGGPFTAPQLKVIQEVFSLTTFAVFSALVLKEKPRWVDLGAFALILCGVLLSLLTKQATKSEGAAPVPLPPPIEPPEPPQVEPAPETLGRRMLGGVAVSLEIETPHGGGVHTESLRKRSATT